MNIPRAPIVGVSIPDTPASVTAGVVAPPVISAPTAGVSISYETMLFYLGGDNIWSGSDNDVVVWSE